MSEKNTSEMDSDKPERNNNPEVRYVPVEYMDQGYREEDEISLIDLIKVIWEGRKKIYVSISFFFLFGLFVFLFAGYEYESDAILIQEAQEQESQFQVLARNLGGFGGGSSSNEAIPPSLYPSIMESADFMLGVINHEVNFNKFEINTTPLVYFNEFYEPPLTVKTANFLIDYTIKLPVTLYEGARSLFLTEDTSNTKEVANEDTRFLNLSSEQRYAIAMMNNRISLESGSKLVTFKVQMPDAVASAELNEYIINRIQEYVVNYRIEKYRQNLEYVEKQMDVARQRYDEAQLELARFSDRNVNITTAVARTQQEELQNRRNITFNVYNTLAQELEQSRIRLQEQTPIFNVLQKPSLPSSPSSGSQQLLIISIILGGFFGIFIVFAEKAWHAIKEGLNT